MIHTASEVLPAGGGRLVIQATLKSPRDRKGNDGGIWGGPQIDRHLLPNKFMAIKALSPFTSYKAASI